MRYKGLDLNLLFALDVLLETRNVSRAAERLGVTQSALSASLARLRDYFSDPLLILDGRRMHPTPLAEQLSEQLPHFLLAADTLLLTSPTFDPASTSRTFRVVASDYVVAAILVKLAQKLATTAPGLRLDFISPERSATEALLRAEIDLIISPREYLAPGHPIEDLYEEQIVLAGWSENEIFTKPLTTKAILDAGHVAVSIGSHRETTFADSRLAAMGYFRRIEAVASSFTVVPWMLRGTQRLALMHERLARVMARQLPLSFAPLPFQFPTMLEAIQYHRTHHSDVGLRWLIGAIRATAETPD